MILALLAAASAADLDQIALGDLAAALPTATAAPVSTRWDDRLRARAFAAWQADPLRASDVLTARAVPTRAGFERVVVGPIDDATWWLLAARAAADEADHDAVVRTLVAVPPRDPEVVAGLFGRERDPVSRALLVAAFARDHALGPAIVATALADRDAGVRAEATRVAGDLGDPALVRPVTARLTDSAASVRALAIDALRAMHAPGAFEAVRPALGDASADVRAAATRALADLDPARFAALPEIRALAADPDPRVRAALPRGAAPALP